jgi:hypothetical protein
VTDIDLTEFFRYSQPKRPPCKVGAVIDLLKGGEKAKLVAALEASDGLITHAAVVTWIDKRGTNIALNIQNVINHRKGKCTCAST